MFSLSRGGGIFTRAFERCTHCQRLCSVGESRVNGYGVLKEWYLHGKAVVFWNKTVPLSLRSPQIRCRLLGMETGPPRRKAWATIRTINEFTRLSVNTEWSPKLISCRTIIFFIFLKKVKCDKIVNRKVDRYHHTDRDAAKGLEWIQGQDTDLKQWRNYSAAEIGR